jgi:hypothetical protein
MHYLHLCNLPQACKNILRSIREQSPEGTYYSFRCFAAPPCYQQQVSPVKASGAERAAHRSAAPNSAQTMRIVVATIVNLNNVT